MAKILIIDDDVSIGNMIEYRSSERQDMRRGGLIPGRRPCFCWRGNGRISSFWI